MNCKKSRLTPRKTKFERDQVIHKDEAELYITCDTTHKKYKSRKNGKSSHFMKTCLAKHLNNKLAKE